MEHEYNIISVNPTTTELAGRKSCPSLPGVPVYSINIKGIHQN